MYKIQSFIFLAFMFLNQPLQAQVYLGLNAGMSITKDATLVTVDEPADSLEAKFDNSFSFAGALGMDWENIRGEIEGSYQKSDVKSLGFEGVNVDLDIINASAYVSATTGLVNLYYDFDLGNKFVPYLGGGIGFSKLKLNIGIDDDDLGTIEEDADDSVLAYQVSAGLAYMLTDNVMLDMRYRYMLTSDPSFTDSEGETVEGEYSGHNFSAGIRISF